jgi:hypothetical protein
MGSTMDHHKHTYTLQVADTVAASATVALLQTIYKCADNLYNIFYLLSINYKQFFI